MHKHKHILLLLLLVVCYLVSRSINLLGLPVFADEAIYTRWAQRIMFDPELLFLPMYDGKTPLHMWLQIPALLMFNNPLLVSRGIAVLCGLVSLLVGSLLSFLLHTSKKAGLVYAVLYLLIPYTFFHDRMGLIDALFVCTLLLSVTSHLAYMETKRNKWLVVLGISFTAALYTRISALFFLPSAALLWLVYQSDRPLLQQLQYRKKFVYQLVTAMINKKFTVLKEPEVIQAVYLMIPYVIALLLFSALSLSDFFPFLFSRGQDFTYPISEVIARGGQPILVNSKKFVYWFLFYLTPGVLLLSCSSFLPSKKILSKEQSLLLAGFLFILPFILTGKVLAPRYVYPIVVFLLPVAANMLELSMQRGRVIQVSFSLLLASSLMFGLYFQSKAWTNPDALPLVAIDRQQYLEDWSSGHGITEVVAFILQQRALHSQVTVATEGSFGTLPDGIDIYLTQMKDLEAVEVIGIGQPIRDIPEEVRQKTALGPVYIVVNEDRWKINNPNCCTLLASYPRPNGAPPLLLLQYEGE